MSPQQFSLRWNNHTKNLVQVFADQFEREQHVDVTISCQGRFLKAHKIVLGACSPYFQEIFDTHESTPHPIIIMNGYDFEDIRSIVEFMYRGEVMVAETCMQRLLAAAEDLQIKGLSNVRSKRDGGSEREGDRGQGFEEGGGGGEEAEGVASNDEQEQEVENGGGGDEVMRGGTPVNQVVNQAQQGKGFGRRRKRARTVSYDSEMKRKLRLNNTRSSAAAAAQQPCNPKEERELSPIQDKPSDLSSELMMTINIEPSTVNDQDDGIGKNDCVDDVVKEVTLSPPTPTSGDHNAKGEKIPRPPNSFMIFANEWRRQLASQFPNESNKEISVRLGLMWKNLGEEVKAKYFNAARCANDAHKKKYPDYHYNPKEARMRKMWKLQQQSMGHLVTAASHH